MSLPVFVEVPVPKRLKARCADLFAADNRYRLFSERIYPLLAAARPELAAAYCPENGREAVEPVLLFGVSLLQFIERVPDRQAVDLLAYHLGWHLALHRPPGQPTFHPTTLVYFRDRLIAHEQSRLVWDQVLAGLVAAGLVPRKSAQRLDATQMWGLLRQMGRLECVRESLRLALGELAGYPQMGRPANWTALWQGYVESQLDFRAEEPVLRAKMNQAGADAVALLTWLEGLEDRSFLAGPQVQLLKRVIEENFERPAQGPPVPRPHQPPGAVNNPHEPEAQWAAKGEGKHRKEHVGYKVQVAETVSDTPRAPGEPTASFLTAIVTQPAIASDEAGHRAVEQAQAEQGLLEPPSAWYVDGSYVSAARLAQARQEGQELIGPAPAAPHKAGRFSAEAFDVDLPQRQATCPAGKPSTQCSRLAEEKTGKVTYRFEWSTHCHACPLRGQCLGADQRHRTLVVGEQHELLQARRREQHTPAFKTKTHRRNAIEGTHSELRRAHGLNRARYRGLAKVRLQTFFIGAACNVKRWIKRVQWELAQAVGGVPPALQSG